MLPRRKFLAQVGATAGSLVALAPWLGNQVACGAESAPRRFHWQRDEKSQLFKSVSWKGTPLLSRQDPGLLNAGCRLVDEAAERTIWLNPERAHAAHGPLEVGISHRLHDAGNGLGEDLLEAVLTVRNTSGQPQRVEMAFATSAQPSAEIARQEVYVPVSAAGLSGDKRAAALGVAGFLKDCHQQVGTAGFQAHYLEPLASYPGERETKALLLAPVVDISHPQAAIRVGVFTSSTEPRRFSTLGSGERKDGWHIGRCVTIPPGQSVTERCWLLLHEGDASVAWKAFHRFGHHEDHPPIAWTREFKVHYYDFLSAADGINKPRGGGYDADLARFREFRVGLATQHGYYPYLGDYIHPDRKTWQAMLGDKQGPAAMSLEKMRARIQATRATGAKAGVYIHPVLFDDACPGFKKLRDSVLVDAEGRQVRFPWQGPDTVGKNWRASLNSPQWTEHLLQQAEWIMELLQPDAICVDETFAGLGYDHHPDRAGPMSAAAIDWQRKLRTLVRSYGDDRAVFTSDCSMSPFVLWADGDVGDHAYPNLLGNPLYRQEPVRYLAALGDKPWRPCAWHFSQMWQHQMALARQVGAGVGVSNGWLEYTGLTRVPDATRNTILADIASLFIK
jgi:hypothetical protein